MHIGYAMLIICLFLAPGSADARKQRDMTDPVLTCGIMGQMIQDMALGLGPIIKSMPDGVKHQTTTEQLSSAPARSGKTIKRTKIVKTGREKIETIEKSFEPETFKYKGAQMWGEAEAVVVTSEDGFDVKVSSSLPVTMWSLKTQDGTTINSSRVTEKTAFKFTINEPFDPPYSLILNVIYMGMPNLLKVDIK